MRFTPSLASLTSPSRVAASFGAIVLAVTVLSGGTAAADTSVTLTVATSGGEYTSVQAAVDAVPDSSPTPYTILIEPGTYEEAVTIPATKLHLTLLGATRNPASVVIDSGPLQRPGEPASTGGAYGAEGSATVHVKASNFTAEYITFSNSFDKRNFPP